VGSEEWRVRKKKSTYAHRMDQISSSYFVTNFSEEIGWGDLWKLFTRFGSVSDVYIPNKVDKRGRRFGFVKFKDVRDEAALSKSLEEVWCDNVKLWVNRARFGKGEEKVKSAPKPGFSLLKKDGEDTSVKDDVSFKSMLVGNKSGGEVTVQGGEKKKFRLNSVGDLAPLELQVCDNTWKELSMSKVAFLRNTVDFHAVADRLALDRNHEVKARQMGGNMVLLQSPCEGELAEVLKCNKQWFDHCFSKVISWKPNMLSESREIWIQVFGLPLHAWDENSFKRLAGRFGVFLDFDEATIEKQRLDVARVKLRTLRRGVIDTVIQLLVMGEFFDVWVVEERC
jgi:hypothetical protein